MAVPVFFFSFKFIPFIPLPENITYSLTRAKMKIIKNNCLSCHITVHQIAELWRFVEWNQLSMNHLNWMRVYLLSISTCYILLCFETSLDRTCSVGRWCITIAYSVFGSRNMNRITPLFFLLFFRKSNWPNYQLDFRNFHWCKKYVVYRRTSGSRLVRPRQPIVDASWFKISSTVSRHSSDRCR